VEARKMIAIKQFLSCVYGKAGIYTLNIIFPSASPEHPKPFVLTIYHVNPIRNEQFLGRE